MHLGPLFGILPTRRQVSIPVVCTTRWSGTQIVRDEWCWNASALMLELLGIEPVVKYRRFLFLHILLNVKLTYFYAILRQYM